MLQNNQSFPTLHEPQAPSRYKLTTAFSNSCQYTSGAQLCTQVNLGSWKLVAAAAAAAAVSSIISDSVRPHRWQPTRLPCPWDSPGKNTGVGYQEACFGFINNLDTHISDYNRLDYGKDIGNKAYCFVTCNCQSKLSVHIYLDEYANALS